MKVVIALIIQIQFFSLVTPASFDFNSNDFHIGAKRFKRAPSPTCLQPPVTPDKTYTVNSPNKDEISNPKPGDLVPQYTVIVSRCNKGYAVDYQSDDSNEYPSVCMRNLWKPPVPTCKKMCKNFTHFSNFDMSCYKYLGGPEIPCNGLLLENAVVKLKCQEKFHPDKEVNYDYATCLEDGTWDKPFYKCVPNCGQVASSSVSLIVDGYPEKRGGAPWYVAIYSSEFDKKTPRFICGGTLITAELGVSAAHCFYDEVFHQNRETSLFHAIVGKATRDYEKQDYTTTKTYKFKNIFFPETTYKGAINNYASDIVIFQLSEKVSFNRDVLPACLHWNERERFNPGENSMGKLSGFGATNNGSLASILLSAQLPYISYAECLKRVREDFLSSISIDKFCAGTEKGPGARSGDSGGGLVFVDKATGLYHLRGVVSNKDLSASSIVTFTDVSQYMNWILRVMETVEPIPDEKKVPGCECNTIGSLSSICEETNKSCKCKRNVIGKNCDTCAPQTYDFGPDGCKESLKWVKYSNGEKCSNAVVGGYMRPKNETIFIARHEVLNRLLPGSLIPSKKLAYIAIYYQSHIFPDYEVLCGDTPTKWVATNKGVILGAAVLGGHVNHCNGVTPVYICRKILPDGSLVVGVNIMHEEHCILPYEGKEIKYDHYEILVQSLG